MNTISNSGNFCARHFVYYLIFKFLKNFVFLLSRQALGHRGCWDDNSIPIFFQGNNENYAFIGIKGSFLTFCSLTSKVKSRSQAFLKIMKIEVESLYIIQQSTNFSKLWYSFKFSVKAFKPYHCHKRILNNIDKMGISQR